MEKTTEKVKLKSEQIIQKTLKKQVNERISKLTNAQEVAFCEVFSENTIKALDSVKGKSINLPTGTTMIVFKYAAEKQTLLKLLENQPATDEAASDETARQIDGKNIISKLKLIKNYLPQDLANASIFEDTANNKRLEFYRVNRFPVKNTLIYNPEGDIFYHLAEVKKTSSK